MTATLVRLAAVAALVMGGAVILAPMLAQLPTAASMRAR